MVLLLCSWVSLAPPDAALEEVLLLCSEHYQCKLRSPGAGCWLFHVFSRRAPRFSRCIVTIVGEYVKEKKWNKRCHWAVILLCLPFCV